MGGRLVRYRGTIPRLRPHALADVGQAMLRIDRMAAKVPLEAPWERTEGAAVGQPDDLVVDAPQHGDPRRPRPDGGRREGRLGRDAGGRVASCTSSSTSPRPASSTCCSTPRAARSRTASSRAREAWPRRWRATLGDRLVLSAPGAPHRVDAGRGARACRRRRGARPAGDRRRAAHACRAPLVRPAAAGLPRPAHTARADGRGDQVLRDLRRAVLARGGPERQRRQLGGPPDADRRQLTP